MTDDGKFSPIELARFATGVKAMRERWRADAIEGERKNAAAKLAGTAPSKVRCEKCSGTGCGACRGFGWKWTDGVVPQACPASAAGTACARPWCWACRNGLRPKAEVDEMVAYQRRTRVGR